MNSETKPKTHPACKVEDCYYDVMRNGYCRRHWLESWEALEKYENIPTITSTDTTQESLS